jgi:hypothetical protein
MTDTVQNLILDLIEWIERTERTYEETMEAWRTSCPRLPVWEDASESGLVERVMSNGRVMVRATSRGLALLEERRPAAYQSLRVGAPRDPGACRATGEIPDQPAAR